MATVLVCLAIPFCGSSVEAAQKKVDFRIDYPVFKTAFINDLINDDVVAFKRKFDAVVVASSEEKGHDIAIVADAVFETDAFVSIRWKTTVKLADQDKPFFVVTGTTIDLNSKQKISLKSLFKPSVPFLNILSEKAFLALKKSIPDRQRDDAWLKRGLDPRPDQFSHFYRTKDALVLIFNPLQVGPASLGVQTASIPLSELKSYLRDQ